MFGFLGKLFGNRETVAAEYATDYPSDEFYSDIIQKCRAQFGAAPRSHSPEDEAYLELTLDEGLLGILEKLNNPMLQILNHQALLCDQGQVVWAHLIQANTMIFDEDNKKTLPAVLVYSLDPYFDGRVELLARLGREMFALKGTVPKDKRLRDFADAITDERRSIMRRELPRFYCGGKLVYYTTFFIQPSHLPNGRLINPAFPIIVKPDVTEAVLMLPCRYWPATLSAYS